jgi:hypothetical protein
VARAVDVDCADPQDVAGAAAGEQPSSTTPSFTAAP